MVCAMFGDGHMFINSIYRFTADPRAQLAYLPDAYKLHETRALPTF